MSTATLRLGTRGSPLARWQADWVAGRLEPCGVAVQLVPIQTSGDRDPVGPLQAFAGVGVFTKEIQRALLERRIDLAVHSLKDLPTDEVPGLVLAAVPPRGPTGDVLVCRDAGCLADLPPGSVVGTGSLRRRAQLWHVRPDLVMHDIRGNVDTRLRKLDERQYAALVLAEAGLRRLGLDRYVTHVLPTSVMLPAVGQGALGIEARADDDATRRWLAALDDRPTHDAILAERSLLRSLCAGCLAPVAAWARIEPDGRLRLTAAVLSHDGQQRMQAERCDDPAVAVDIGRRAADDLLERGAGELIEAARRRS